MKATVKLVGEQKASISQATGYAWKSNPILIEWKDDSGTHRAWGSMFNEEKESFERQGIGVGDTVEAQLYFSARSYRTGFTSTEVGIEDIKKVSSPNS